MRRLPLRSFACPPLPGKPLAAQQNEQGDVYRCRAVVHEEARDLGLRHRFPPRRLGVEQLREHVVRGHSHHEHARTHGEPGPVRRRVRADQREGEQIAGQQHVDMHDQRGHRRRHVRPVQQPQPAHVEQRGDGGMGEYRQWSGAEHPAQVAGTPPRQGAQCQRHRCRRHEQYRGGHAEEQVPRHVQPQVVRTTDGEHDRADCRRSDPEEPPRRVPGRPSGGRADRATGSARHACAGQWVGDPAHGDAIEHGGTEQNGDQQLGLDERRGAVVDHAVRRAVWRVATASVTPASSSPAAITFQTVS